MICKSPLQQLQTLQHLLKQINDEQYTQPIEMLGGSSIGQHVRHIAELPQSLQQGYELGIVNDDDRKRDARIEPSISFTHHILHQLIGNIQQDDRGMSLEQLYCSSIIHTTYFRELHYNTEHAIHHMALIRVALREMKIETVDENFGVANASIQFKKRSLLCAP